MRRALVDGLRQRGRNEEGAVLVLVAICMVFMLGMAGLAIDVGSWYQTQRQAQSAADAAALAGAQDLPGSPATATTDAQSYGNKNMGCTSCTTVTTPYQSSASQIQATVTAQGAIWFARILGIGSPTITAVAAAKAAPGRASCPTPGSGCYAVFAMDSSCSGSAVTFGGGTHITGGVNSNGSLNVGGGGSTFGPTTYGNGSGCTVGPSGYQQQNNTFTSGPTSQAPSATWPIDYSADFPACTGAACTGPSGTPSFCTQATTAASETLQTFNPINLTSGNIYCDVGTGTPGTPTTWNGAITANGGTVKATFVAGSVTFGGGTTASSCGYTSSGYSSTGVSTGVPTPATTNYPVVYALGSGTAINNGGGGGTFSGDMFAPNGTIYMGGGTSTTFLEGKDVSIPGGGFTGDGPTYSGGPPATGSGSLVQ
jgi:Flp pilus assembly protein TadG